MDGHELGPTTDRVASRWHLSGQICTTGYGHLLSVNNPIQWREDGRLNLTEIAINL